MDDMTEDSAGIVVGVDSTSAAAHAFRWAMAQRDRFGAVRPVAAWTNPWWYTVGAPLIAPDGPGPDIAAAARHIIDSLTAGSDRTGLLEPLVAKGSAASVLIDHAAEANLLVVGTRGRGVIAEHLLGSVSAHCASRARIPVAVVPEDCPVTSDGPVLVGIDGSAGSDAALDWALATTPADRRIVAMRAWDIPVLTGYEAVAIDPEVVERATVDAAAHQVAEACTRADVPPGRIEAVVREGDARDLLSRGEVNAEMTVVGRRGHTRIAQLVLGSVATSLVHQPNGPVVVVPAD
jgi:nucleotide-binding universal stress UspA family protein